MSEVEICKITNCSFSSLIETGSQNHLGPSSTCAQLHNRTLNIVPMLFATLSPMSSSLHLTFVFFFPSLIPSFSPYSFSAPLSFPPFSPLLSLSSPLSYPLFLLPVTLISPLSPLPPFLTLCLFSPLSQFLLLELKGSSLAQAWGLLGARGGHCVPWFILGLPQLCAVHLGSSVNFPSSEIGTKSKGEGDSANGLFCLCRNQRSPQRNVFTSMTHKA